MFEKTLQDLVKGLRNTKGDTTAFVAKAIQEIKDESKSRDVTIKAQALQKLTYLNMMGHDMTWASFTIIEIMSQERFGLKRIGFLAASQSFNSKTDVIVLCTQLLKKEFQAKSAYEIGLAINCLSNIATEDLARDLLGDVVMMLTSSRPYIRKKATLVLYKLYLAYPQGLRLTFDNLKRRLTDEVPSIVSCAVNVVCELARKKPSNYLALAPDLFTLMTASSNNWMLIKVAKLMSALVQEEPRLARKLLEPLANVVQTTPAKSLMYEAISTITFALQHTKRPDGSDAKNASAVVRLCTDRLREMVRDPDANLKYLGLTGLTSLMRSNPRVVAEHRELVLTCLVDEDVTIRLRALELVTGMVTRRNLNEIVKRLLELLENAEGHFRDELIDKVIFMCSRDKFAYLADFAWYVSVLSKMAYITDTKHSSSIAGQLLDVAVRVEDVRGYAVQALLPMLADPALAANARKDAATAASLGSSSSSPKGEMEAPNADGSNATAASLASGTAGSGAVLYAAAWITGEFCSVIPPQMHSAVIDALLNSGALSLPQSVQGVYVQSALKVLASAAAAAVKAGGPLDASNAFIKLAATALEKLAPFASSVHVEVQERACLVQQLLAALGVPFTAPATATNLAAAKARAAEDLMALAGAPPTASPSKAGGAPLPPLEADVKLIGAVLSALFSEPLKPVNAKAQRKVALPEGLDLDKWITPEEEADFGRSDNIKYLKESISFEESCNEKDDDYASAKGGRKDSSAGDGGRKSGKASYDVGAGDEDDDNWLADLAAKNKARDKKLWGGDEEEKPGKKGAKTKKGRAAAAAAEAAAEAEAKAARASRRGGAGDPYMLGGGAAKGRAESSVSGPDRDMEVDSIPIAKLETNELKKALDVSIFGDFGKKEKKKGKKDGKKGKKGAEDDDEEDVKPSKSYKVADDDDMPEGAADSDADDASGIADKLAEVDLSTPLRDDEMLPKFEHRRVNDPAALAGSGGKGRGRARNLHGGAGEEAAEKPKKEKKKAKGEKEAEEPAKKEKKDKKEAKAEKEPKEKEKEKKEAKAEKADKEPAAKKPKADKEKAEKEAKPAKEPKAEKPAKSAPAAAPAASTSGDAVASSPCMDFPLFSDKAVRLTFTVTGVTALPQAPVVPSPVDGDAVAPAPASPAASATIVVKVEPRSSKKALDYVDVTLCPAAAAALLPPAPSSTTRVATGVKEKSKGKDRSKAGPLGAAVVLPDGVSCVEIPCKVTYLVNGASAPVTVDAVLRIDAAAQLVPTSIDAEAYRALMTSAGGGFTSSIASIPIGAGADAAAATIASVIAVLRSFAVARGSEHAILYARTARGANVTALIKVSADRASLAVTAKSEVPAHAKTLTDDVARCLAAAAGKGEDAE